MKGPSLCPDWQQNLLSFTFRISGIVVLVASLISLIFYGEFRTEFIIIGFFGSGLLLFSGRGVPYHRVKRIAYFVAVSCVVIIMGTQWAWTPSMVVAICYWVIIAGFFVGRFAVYGVVVASSALWVLGGLVVAYGVYEISAPLNPYSGKSWNMAAFFYFSITGGAVLVLRRAVGLVNDTATASHKSLLEVNRNLANARIAKENRKSEEHALVDAQKLQMVAQLGNGFAHVFNNFLTIVRYACENARKATSAAQLTTTAETICTAVTDCADKTKDLLLLSRPHDATAQPMVLNESVQTLSEKLAERLRGNVRLKLSLKETGKVMLSTMWLEQILSNLLLNAEQAMPGGGRVFISTGRVSLDSPLLTCLTPLSAGDYVILSVKDNGVGMSSDVLDRACDPFYTTKGRERHDGLGLSLVHSMTKKLGGSIEVQSRQGRTVVTLYLPQFNGVSATGEGRSSEEARSTRSKRDSNPEVSKEVRLGVQRIDEHAQSEKDDGQSEHKAEDRTIASLVAEAVALDKEERSTGPLEAWKRETLTPLLTLIIVVGAFVAATAALFMEPAPSSSTYVILGIGILLLIPARLAKGGALWWRLGFLIIALLAIGGHVLLFYSYLSSTGVAVLAFSVFVAAVFCRPAVSVSLLLLTTAVFVVSGWLWGHAHVSGSITAFSPDNADNWFRTAISLPCLALLVASTVLKIFDAAREQVAKLEYARLELERVREEVQSEMEAANELAVIRRRAVRIESIGKLTGMVAHDLNNCLAGIMGWGEFLCVVKDPERREKAFRGIEESIAHAEALVQQLQLKVDGTHSGESLHLSYVLGRMRSLLEALAQRNEGCTLGFGLEIDDGCYAGIRESSFRRLVLNLVANARDAMSDGGRCRIRLKRHDDVVELIVEDDGIGMDGETKAHLFDAFYTTKDDGQGTGLGLHTVADIVDDTNGKIDVWSEKGEGSRIAIKWLLTTPKYRAHRLETKQSIGSNSGRILLAEDEAVVRRLLAKRLRDSGYTVVEAKDGDEAYKHILGEPAFDAFCTDAVMPGLPTPKVVERFRTRYPHQPVVVISGYLPGEFGRDLLEHPNTMYLSKPFTHSELVYGLESLFQPHTGVQPERSG